MKSAGAGEYPKSSTQPARLLAVLLMGRRINPLAGWKQLGIYRLSDTVLRLRKMGWSVCTDHLDVANRFNEQCRVADYLLAADTIQQAGERGAQFATDVMASLHGRRGA